MMTITEYRDKSIGTLKSEEFDLLIIGGGITGAGILRDAQLRGYKAALIEKEDFGSGTSSGSSKLIHAGLRYLGQKEFKLVREASVERKRLIEMIPSLSRPLPFLIPMYTDSVVKKSKIRLALWLYDLLAGFRNYGFHKFHGIEESKMMLPAKVKTENFEGTGYYFDGQMDDVRITEEVILSAEDHGGVVLNHAEAIEFVKREGGNSIQEVVIKDKISGITFNTKARYYCFAVGHWENYLVKLINPDASLRIRPTKGIHMIVKRFYHKEYAVTCPVDDGRIIFLLPFGKYNIIGTTDTDYNGDLDYVPVKEEDINYLIVAINKIFDQAITKEDIVSAYSGLRPLIKPEIMKSESDVSRTHEIIEVANNVLSIAGGKFTTFRQMSEDFVDKMESSLEVKNKCKTTKIHYHSWDNINRNNWNNWCIIAKEDMRIRYKLDDDIIDHLLSYGIHYEKICKYFMKNPEIKSRISSDRPYILAEIDFFVKKQHALTLNDVMFRRTQIQLSENQGLDCVDVVAKRMKELLSWSDQKVITEIEAYKKALVWK